VSDISRQQGRQRHEIDHEHGDKTIRHPEFPLLEPVHSLAESSFTITESRGGFRQALQIPLLRYLRAFEVKFQM
jgi:hypothetical protein